MNNLNIIYYIGVIVLIIGMISIITVRFKDYDNIDLKEHFNIIIMFIIILIFTIILWRVVFNFIFHINHTLQNQNIIYERVLNG